MTFLQIILLAIIQGLAELLPVSSSAHVIVALKLMGFDPTAPAQTFLIVMLHTGTMFAVIAYFAKAWKKTYFPSMAVFKSQAVKLIVATAITGIIGLGLKVGIEHAAATMGYVTKDAAGHAKPAEIERLFGNLGLVSVALAAAGVLIIVAGLSKKSQGTRDVGMKQAGWIGAIQGLTLPFRGFSRSGATISLGLLMGSLKSRVEEFSFALAVLLTPAIIAWEGRRLLKDNAAAETPLHFGPLVGPGLLGLVFSFLAGLVALKLLSRVLEKGRWHLFGFYCLCFAVVVFGLYLKGL
jgi:undecaprenyl-diphosphatase